MTTQSFTEVPVSGDRLAGQLAIIRGVFGIAAVACLIAFQLMRPSEQRIAQPLLRGHDAGIIFPSLCLIPFTLALHAIARHLPESSRVTVAAALTFLILVVVLMLLAFVKAVADVLYMIPQGADRSSSDLLTHTSGLPALPSRLGSLDPRNPYTARSETDLLASLGEVRLTRPLGGARSSRPQCQAKRSPWGTRRVVRQRPRREGGGRGRDPLAWQTAAFASNTGKPPKSRA